MEPSLESTVRSIVGGDVVSTQPVGGGCISVAQRIELGDGRVLFAKAAGDLPEDLLEVEAEGLRWLAEPMAVNVPQVIGLGEGVLLLEWIESGPRQGDTISRLGTGLAHLHAAGAPGFGWHRDGFIGSLHQANTRATDDDWPGFWFTRRIQPLARQAIDARSLSPGAGRLVDQMGERLPDLAGPAEPPARVHGDLWTGNVLVGTGGEPWLIDPAAYGGHREVDLAMLHLFGNPGPAFVDAYEEVSPLAPGWRERLSLWQLEPLLVHAVLFGGAYGDQALSVLKRFI